MSEPSGSDKRGPIEDCNECGGQQRGTANYVGSNKWLRDPDNEEDRSAEEKRDTRHDQQTLLTL